MSIKYIFQMCQCLFSGIFISTDKWLVDWFWAVYGIGVAALVRKRTGVIVLYRLVGWRNLGEDETQKVSTKRGDFWDEGFSVSAFDSRVMGWWFMVRRLLPTCFFRMLSSGMYVWCVSAGCWQSGQVNQCVYPVGDLPALLLRAPRDPRIRERE